MEYSDLVANSTKCDIDIQLELVKDTGSSQSGFSPSKFSPLHRHNPARMRNDNKDEGKKLRYKNTRHIKFEVIRHLLGPRRLQVDKPKTNIYFSIQNCIREYKNVYINE